MSWYHKLTKSSCVHTGLALLTQSHAGSAPHRPPVPLVIDAGHGARSRAQKRLLPSHKLLGVVDRPQEVRGRLLIGYVLDGAAVFQVFQAIIDGFDGHAEGRIA